MTEMAKLLNHQIGLVPVFFATSSQDSIAFHLQCHESFTGRYFQVCKDWSILKSLEATSGVKLNIVS